MTGLTSWEEKSDDDHDNHATWARTTEPLRPSTFLNNHKTLIVRSWHPNGSSPSSEIERPLIPCGALPLHLGSSPTRSTGLWFFWAWGPCTLIMISRESWPLTLTDSYKTPPKSEQQKLQLRRTQWYLFKKVYMYYNWNIMDLFNLMI